MDKTNNYKINHEINEQEIVDYVDRQLKNFYPDRYENRFVIAKNIAETFDRLLFSLKHIKLAGYTTFSYLHSDLYAKFLYFLANTIWVNTQDSNACSKL